MRAAHRSEVGCQSFLLCIPLKRKLEFLKICTRRRRTDGEPGAVEALALLLYDQLHYRGSLPVQRARPTMPRNRQQVFNEVFVDLLRRRRLSLKDRAHFFTFAAQLTRRMLIDSARKAKSEKRGREWQCAPLDAELAWLGGETAESLELSLA